jgi:hypothetical protein
MQSIGNCLAGYQLALFPDVEAFWVENSGGSHTPEHPQKRRYSAKGKASGSIELRFGNRRRSQPTVSYYYLWYEHGAKRKLYIKVGKLPTLQKMIAQHCTVEEILGYLKG